LPVLLPTPKLQKICDPYKENPWQCWVRLTRKDIRAAIKEGRFIASEEYGESHQEHIERIAYLVVNGWDDPISVDVGIPSMACNVNWMILDGNHRFAAAIYKKEPIILASVAGSVSYALELFGVDISETT
jgi:hypothetical protein